MRTLALASAVVALAATQAGAWETLSGKQAPSFPIENWFNPAEGSTLEDFRGKAVLLEFWATW